MNKYLLLFFSLFLLTACGDDEETGGGSASSDNANQNPATLAEFRRLEMPRLKQGSDTVLIQKLSDGTVNYIMEYDYSKKVQRWSAYILTAKLLEQNTKRYEGNPQYPQDPLLPHHMRWVDENDKEFDPFTGNGMRLDHGHICPSADRLNTAEANKQTFYLSNMMPQFNSFNAGVWAKMEAKVRTIAKGCDTLYVCKGGTIDGGTYGSFNKTYNTLANGMLIPRFYYMALLRVSNGHYSAIGLWIDQVSDGNDSGKDLARFAVSIDELESRTGIDFFCNLPDATEQQLESGYGTANGWGL